jgi:DNA-binding FadR family transcriptional regulator
MSGIGRSAAHRAAHVLREEILRREDGDLLGSEDELIERLGVSRPTLRQAARLLEHEQVLLVRRGVKGGYYARKPDVGSVAHVAAFYLRARGTTLRETFLAAQPLFETAIRRAAAMEDAFAREKALGRFTRSDSRPLTRTMLEQETEFMETVLELSANPAIELFVRILNQFGLTQTNARFFAGRSERVHEWSEARERLAEAIVAGDAEMAVLLNRRRGLLLLGWMTEDVGLGEKP